MSKHRKIGSASIEAAIAFSIVLVLIVYVVNEIVLYKTDLMMQAAVEQTCEDYALMMPLSIPTTDVISTLINAAPDEISELGEGVIGDVLSYIGGYDIASGNAVTAAVLDVTLSQSFENDIASGYIERNGSDFFMPDYIDVDFEIDGYRSIVYVIVEYEVNTIRGHVGKRIIGGIPFYGDMELFLYGGDNQEGTDEDRVWQMDNLRRGVWFAEHYGANLPHTFPVINRWDGSTATSIVSINTTSPTYQDINSLAGRVYGQIDNLSKYEGSDVNISGNHYSITADEIQSRVLIVVIPENTSELQMVALHELELIGQAQGVDVQVEQFGTA